jgi:hypothetical protein
VQTAGVSDNSPVMGHLDKALDSRHASMRRRRSPGVSVSVGGFRRHPGRARPVIVSAADCPSIFCLHCSAFQASPGEHEGHMRGTCSCKREEKAFFCLRLQRLLSCTQQLVNHLPPADTER